MERKLVAIVFAHVLAACATTPEPRPAAVDPSNPEAPLAAPIEPFEAFAVGPQGLDESLLPSVEGSEEPGVEAPGRDQDAHEGHEGHDGHDDHEGQEGHEGHGSPEGHDGHGESEADEEHEGDDGQKDHAR